MQLTIEELNAAANGQAVEITIDGNDFVLLRRDVYNRVQRVVDDEGPDPLATARLIRETMAADDADDPLLESYQRYKGNP
jgi:hypothetical protein